MLPFAFALALALPFHRASAAPQTFAPNFTIPFSSAPAVTNAPTGNCSNNCSYSLQNLYSMTWSQMSITATYTAETVVLIVNKRNNSTRTTTISNTEIDFAKIPTPTNLNSDGTVTASVVDDDGSTRVVAYPTTVYSDYAPYISWTGTLSTTVNGTPTCSIAPTGAAAVFPSHPLIPEGVQTTGVNMIEDPRGWTFIANWDEACAPNFTQDFFPGLGVWNCKAGGTCVSPAEVLQAALYLTKTSTSTEPDDGPTSTGAPASSAQLPTATAAPLGAIEFAPAILQPASDMLPVVSSISAVGVLVPTTSTTPAVDPISSPLHSPAPAILQPASDMLSVVSKTSAPVSKSIIITPSPALATTFPTTPVAVPVTFTSTDSKGSIVISANTVIAHPIIISSTNAQGSIITSTSLSTASVSAFLPTIVTSTNAQGTILTSTAHLPAIIFTTTNAAGSKIVTTSALSAFTPPVSAPAPIIIHNSETITPNAQSHYIISSQTLYPGGSSITLGSGTSTTLLALQTSSGSTALVFGPSTSLLPSAAGTAAALTIGTETITPNAQSQYLIFGSTLAAGSTITLTSGSSTTVLALQTSGSQTALVYAPSTSFLTSLPTTPPAITIGSETITANSQTQYLIGSQTLTAGGVVTVSGTEVSLAAGESDVVVGTRTEPLAPYITAGFGSGMNGTTPQIFAEGAAGKRDGRRRGWREIWRLLLGVGVGVALYST